MQLEEMTHAEIDQWCEAVAFSTVRMVQKRSEKALLGHALMMYQLFTGTISPAHRESYLADVAELVRVMNQIPDSALDI